ncbi:MAG: SDR family NAD(P)-dependent oxidoreductase [Burkholderiales bacterium]|nr:SDR family NAD(P)-dependent oxidoreductase [Burkholderiales bacterium]
MNPPIADWRAQRVWVIGSSSGIGAATAIALLRRGARLALSARNRAALEALAAKFDAAQSLVLPLDLAQPGATAPALERIAAAWGGIDLVLFVAGAHRPVRAWELDAGMARGLFEVNVLGVMDGLSSVIPYLLKQGRGGIGIVSSVAGYRGLPTALAYGATKAALINLAETLYFDLAPRGLGVYLINPGFVKTPLTDRNEFRMPALIGAEEAAREIVRGLERGQFEIHFPRRFTRWLKVMRILPYRWYFYLMHKLTGL